MQEVELTIQVAALYRLAPFFDTESMRAMLPTW
jgi:hypothetical protein